MVGLVAMHAVGLDSLGKNEERIEDVVTCVVAMLRKCTRIEEYKLSFQIT